MQRVEGKEGLVKDPRTGAVINIDDQAFQAARRAHKRIISEINQRQEMEKQLADQEDRIRRLEALLTKDHSNGTD